MKTGSEGARNCSYGYRFMFPWYSSLSLDRKPTLSFCNSPLLLSGERHSVISTASPSTARDRAGIPFPVAEAPQRADLGMQGASMAPWAGFQTDQLCLCYNPSPQRLVLIHLQQFPSQPLLESLAGTVGCQSNLLEGQKEMINRFQNTYTHKSTSLSCSSEIVSLSGQEATAPLCSRVSLGSIHTFFLASPELSNYHFVLCCLVTEISDSCFTASTRQW